MWDSLDMVARRETYIHRRQSNFHTRLGPCGHCDVKDSKDPYYAVWYLLEVKHSRQNLNKYIFLKFFERKALCQTDIFGHFPSVYWLINHVSEAGSASFIRCLYET